LGALRASLRATAAGGEQPSWWRWAVALTVSLGALMEVIDTSIVNVALPSMQNSLGATLSEIGWVITGYAMANVVIIPLGAWLSEYFGQRNYFLFTLVAFVAASMLCGLATTLPMLIFARILQGLFGGGLLPKAQAILFETFPPHQQGIAQAVFGICVVVGPAFGPTLGGWLTDDLGWRSIFFVNLPVGIFATLMAMLFVPDKPRRARGSVDYLGILLLAASLASMQVVLEEGNSKDWFDSPLICWLTVVAVLSLVGFIWHELRTAHPAVNLRVLRHQALAAGSLFGLILGIGLYGTVFVIPVFTQSILNYTATQTGEMLIPGSLLMVLFMPMIGALVNKIDTRIIIGIGATIMAFVMFDLATVNVNTSEYSFYLPLIWRGFALTCMFIPLSVATLGALPKQDVAAGAGIYNLTRQIGGSIGIAVLATFLNHRQQFHAERIASTVSAYSPKTQQFLQGVQAYAHKFHGYDLPRAGRLSIKLLDGLIQQQGAILAFEDVYIFVGVLFVISLALLFFLGKGHKGRPLPDAH
jgi:DHA2 family multidrug resistance protein